MEAKRLAGLEPAAVFGYFEEICAIPHGSLPPVFLLPNN